MPAKLTTLSQFSQHSNITSKGYKTYRVSLCQTVRLHSIDRANPAIIWGHLAIRIEPESAVKPWSATVVGMRLRERVRARDFPLRKLLAYREYSMGLSVTCPYFVCNPAALTRYLSVLFLNILTLGAR